MLESEIEGFHDKRFHCMETSAGDRSAGTRNVVNVVIAPRSMMNRVQNAQFTCAIPGMLHAGTAHLTLFY